MHLRQTIFSYFAFPCANKFFPSGMGTCPNITLRKIFPSPPPSTTHNLRAIPWTFLFDNKICLVFDSRRSACENVNKQKWKFQSAVRFCFLKRLNFFLRQQFYWVMHGDRHPATKLKNFLRLLYLIKNNLKLIIFLFVRQASWDCVTLADF